MNSTEKKWNEIIRFDEKYIHSFQKILVNKTKNCFVNIFEKKKKKVYQIKISLISILISIFISFVIKSIIFQGYTPAIDISYAVKYHLRAVQ